MCGVWHFWRFNCHIVKRLWGKQIILIISMIISGLQLPFRSSFIIEGWKVHLTEGTLKISEGYLLICWLPGPDYPQSFRHRRGRSASECSRWLHENKTICIKYISRILWSEHALILPKDIGSWLTLHCAPFRAEKHADINMYLIIFSDTYG